MKKTLLLLSLTLLLLSCQKTVVYKQNFTDFEDNQWVATDSKKFDFELKKDIESGDIKLMFSHVYEPQYSTVPVSVTIVNPSGEMENIFLNLQLKDEDGNNTSECAGDICDYYHNIKEGVKLQKGKYSITVDNKFAYAYLANVLGVGISVERED